MAEILNSIKGVWIGYFLEQSEQFILKNGKGEILNTKEAYTNIEQKWNVPGIANNFL